MQTKKLIALLFVAMPMSVCAQLLPYQNANLTPEERVEDLCSRLTVEEKISLMMNNSPAIPRLGIPQFEWWNEALHGGAQRYGHGVSGDNRHGCVVERRTGI